MFKIGHSHVLAALGAFIVLAPHAEPQSASSSVPRRLTLPLAENLLIERNLSVLAARYQIEVNRAARLIASYKPNPVLTVSAEQPEQTRTTSMKAAWVCRASAV